ncbi:MAG: endolytic transglycosylase MltG, partial [Actinomycetes bacterium]
NRLAKPMRLQLDSTLNYELNSNTIILTSEQLQQDSAYNTYTNDGLPPGPISNPSEAAINAVLNPEEGDWLYWVTVNLDTKETKFSNNNDQFLKDKQEFLRWYSQNQ